METNNNPFANPSAMADYMKKASNEMNKMIEGFTNNVKNFTPTFVETIIIDNVKVQISGHPNNIISIQIEENSAKETVQICIINALKALQK